MPDFEFEETLIPLARIVSRLENHRDYFQKEIGRLPWWAWKRRLAYAASAAIYEHEINALLELGGKHTLSQIMQRTF